MQTLSSLTFGELGRAVIEGLLEEIARAFQLLAAVALDELGQVSVPYVKHVGPLEHGHAALVGLEGVLEEVVLLEEEAVVDDDLGGGDPQVHQPIVHRFARLNACDNTTATSITSFQAPTENLFQTNSVKRNV